MPTQMYWDGTQYVPILGVGVTDHGALTGLADNDHPQYVRKVGDTMTGPLVLDVPADTSGDKALQINRDAYPEILLKKPSASLDRKNWSIYMSGVAASSSVDDEALSYAIMKDVGSGNNGVFRMHRDGRFSIPGGNNGPGVEFSGATNTKRYIGMRTASNGSDGIGVMQDAAANTLGPLAVMSPNLPEHAATKDYVDNTLGYDAPGSRRCLYAPTDWSIANNVWTKLTGGWDVTGADNGNTGALVYSSGIITVTQNGVYDVSAWISWVGSNTTGVRIHEILINGTAWATGGAPGSPNGFGNSATITGHYFGSGTTIQIQAYQNSGAAINASNGRWWVRRVANG